MKNLVFGLLLLLLGGCAQGHKQFYRQVAPKKYPPTSDVMIFRYRNVEIEEIYNLLFSDLLIIGKSSFRACTQSGVRMALNIQHESQRPWRRSPSDTPAQTQPVARSVHSTGLVFTPVLHPISRL